MTKKTMYKLGLLLLFAVLLGGCEFGPQSLAQVPADVEGGPNAWVEFPPHGETMDMGPIPIVVYAASTEGVSGVTVSVDGETLPAVSMQPLTTDNSTRLVRVDHTWQPPGEGQYTVDANAGGASSSATFCVVTCFPVEESEDSPDVPTATYTDTPADADAATFTPSPSPAPDEPTYTPTATAAPSDTPTATAAPSDTPTPTATAYTESSAEFWAAPPYINQGECTTLNWNVYGDFQAVYYEGSTVSASGSQTECPPETYTYHLQVIEMNGSTTDHWATVDVYEPPPADTSGPTINYVTHFWEGCTIYGEAGITDPSGVIWAEFWFNHNEAGWAWIQMNNSSGDQWVSQVGIETGGFAGSLVYKVRTEDSYNNESWSGEYTHNYAYCGE